MEERGPVVDLGLNFYKGIFEFCPEGVFVIDAGGSIRAWNQAMEKMTGWRREEVFGQGCMAIFQCRFERGEAVCNDNCPGRFAFGRPWDAKNAELMLRTKERKEIIVSSSYGFVPIDSPLCRGYVVGVIREITRKKRAEKEKERLAITDDLTGLYNFRYFKQFFDLELKRSIRYQHPLSLIMVDIDYFKHYNDLHGHPAGNEVLKRLATLLRENTRETNVVARYGGEEFAIILPETEKPVAVEAADRLRKIIQEEVFPHEKEQPQSDLTVSMGVANYPTDAKEAETLIRAADEHLYRAKHLGRNRIESEPEV